MTDVLAETWSQLLAAAVLGTDRRPLPPPPPGRLGAFGLGAEPAVALLDRAAAVLAMRRAGAVPEPAGPALVPCPEDARPPCPTPAARRLGRLVEGRHPDLLPEWLQTLVARGLRLPPEHLAALMDRTRSDPQLRALAVRAAGPAMGWLAGVLPSLGWAAPPGPDLLAAWKRGSPADRVAALQELRSRDPAGARALLAGGLVGERAALRAACYATVATGLGREDEPLLERALDDRSAVVREVAARLLAALPASAWGRRMSERAEAMVRVVGEPGQDRFDVSLVAPVPPDWERDGVSATARRGTSLGVHALHQVVAGAPLAMWARLGPPSHLIVLAGEHELGRVLLSAWSEAASRQREPAWARPLLEELADPALVAVLDPVDQRRAALRAAEPGEVLSPLALAAFASVPLPWPHDLRSRVADAVVALFAERRAGRHQAPLLRRLARELDPALLPELADSLCVLGLPPPIDGVRDDLVDLVRFRAEMLEELAVEVLS